MNNDNSNLTSSLSKPKKHHSNHRRSTAITGESLAYSRQSILTTVKTFVKSVDNMCETVLVPSKLRDMDAKDFSSGHRDLYNLYNVLNEVKDELLWPESATTSMSSPEVSLGYSACNSLTSNSSASGTEDESMGSFDSRSTGSDYESGDLDSVSAESTAESSVDEETSRLAATFRYHLQGIKAILNSLGDSADFLSDRYQEEIESTTSSS